MTHRLNALLKPILLCSEWGLFLFFLVLVILTFTQVVLRYVFNSSLFWGQEVIFFLFTWLIFLSAAVGMARGSHFSVDLVVRLLPNPLGRVCAAFIQFCIVSILIFFCVVGFKFAAQAWPQESDILRFPMTWMYLALPVAASIMLLITARNVVAILTGESIETETEEKR